MNSKFYDEAYFQAIRGASDGDPLYSGFMALLGESPQGLRVLDLGCGRGEMVERLDRAGVSEIHGLDFSEAAVQMTRARVRPEQVDNIRQGSATDRSLYPAGSFDVIYMLDVVEHLPPSHLTEALRNARYWLKPEGRLVVHTFPTLGLHRLYRAWLLLNRKRQQLELLDQIHCNVQTRARLRRTLGEAGFSQAELWLKNDFTRTSSTFQALPEGFIKRALAVLLERVLGHPRVVAFFSLLGLAEWACPSIYGVAHPGSEG